MMELKITPSVQTIVKPPALGPIANTDTKLLIDDLFQKGRVLAQDGEDGELLAKIDILESQLATSLEGRDQSANKRRNHAGMVPADWRLIKFGGRG